MHDQGAASGGLEFNSLLHANFAAVPRSIPVIALAFVYQNVVPVVATSLEGDLPRVRCICHSLYDLMLFYIAIASVF
jgi:hypothetical protein